MKRLWGDLVAVSLIAIALLNPANAATCAENPPNTDAALYAVTVIEEGKLAVYTCSGEKAFETSKTVVTATCSTDWPTATTEACSANQVILCNPGAFVKPTASVKVEGYTGGNDALYLAYKCPADFRWSAADDDAETAIKITECIDGDWTYIYDICISSSATAAQCATFTAAESSTEVSGEGNDHVKFYKCDAEKAWLSGEAARATTCVDGAWTDIWDICEEKCRVPRDCADVLDLGLTVNTEYLVVPSGRPKGNIYKVYCLLEAENSDTKSGKGWTLIYEKDATDMSVTAEKYIKGFWEFNTFREGFIGLDFLYEVNLNEDGGRGPGMMLEISFLNNELGLENMSTYGDFVVGAPPTYSITSLGEYHGEAGDGLCPHLNNNFAFPTDDTTPGVSWWGVNDEAKWADMKEMHGSYLTKSISWQNVDISAEGWTGVTMWIRPKEYDATRCPPMIGSEPWWQYTTASIPFERTLGIVITWSCTKELFYEGEEGGTRTTEGAVECVAGAATGSRPVWNSTVTLPCTLECPANFVAAPDGERCLHFSTDKANNFVDAAMKCLSFDSTLAVMTGELDLTNATATTEYFVNHAKRSVEQTDVFQTAPQTDAATPVDIFTCDQVCEPEVPPEKKLCALVTTPTTFRFEDCDLPAPYICQLPPICPPDYVQVNGGCYAAHVSATNTALEGLTACAKLYGGGLAYPTTADMLKNLLTITTVTGFTGKAPFVIGLNNMDPTWTSDGRYTIDETFKTNSLASQPALTYMKLDHTTAGVASTPLEMTPLADISTLAVGSFSFLCQYPGPMGCKNGIPPLTGNMTLSSFDNKTVEDTEATYTCDAGYFLNGNVTYLGEQKVKCQGIFGDWMPSTLLPCIRVPVCEDTIPVVQSSHINVTDDADSNYLDGTLNYTCPESMGFGDLTQAVTATCGLNQDTSVHEFTPTTIEPCDKCLGDLAWGNATIDGWIAGSAYSVAGLLEVTCLPEYEVEYNVTTQNVNCSWTGWTMDELKPCKPVCNQDEPPAPSANVLPFNVTANLIGTKLNYTCGPGFNFLTTEDFPIPSTQSEVTCEDSGTWVSSRNAEALDCFEICTDAPPAAPESSATDWNNITRINDTQITYTCESGSLFGTYLDTWNITCNGTEWDPPISDASLFVCKKACLELPVEEIGGAKPTLQELGFVNVSRIYECPKWQADASGNSSLSIMCTDDGWSTYNDTFLCEDACTGDLPAKPALATWDFTGDVREGTNVTYWCLGGFRLSGLKEVTTQCVNQNWTRDTVTECFPITTPGPSTVAPHVLDIPNEFDLHYKFTSLNFESEIHASFGDVNAVDDNFETTTGPFGFGSATALRSVTQQCMKKVAFTGTGENCFANPIFCNDGISFSIWVRPYAFGNIMEGITPETEEYQYIMSTGGDTEGHPGFAIMHQEFWLVAVVSTGDMYWKVSVTNPIESKIWNNVAVIWHKDTGLKLLVNTTVIGTKFYSEAVTNPQLPLDPAELIIGCHKDSSNEEYRGYNNADFDEFAIWLRVLEGPEINYLNGGYNETDTSMTPAMLASVIENVDLTSPEQRDAAIAIMAKVSDSLNNEAPSEPTASSAQGVSSTASSPLFQSTTPQWTTESVDNMKNMYVVIEKMLRPDNLLNVQEIADTKSGMAITSAIDNLLMPSNTMSWRGVQEQCDEAGVMQIAQMYREYIDQALLVTRYPNGTEPFCTTMSTHNMLDQICMMRIEDLQNQGRMYEKPRYNTPDFERYLDEWETPYDRSAFDTTIFRDPRCDKRAVGIHITVYDTIASVVHTGVNPSVIDPNTQHAIDSRILSYTLVVQPAYTSDDEVDTSEPRCIPDPEYLQMYPVRIKLEHETPILALRTILFHEDLLDSDIEVRRCVKWNADLSDFGSWDSTGCVTMETTAHYTKCACDDFGVFAIMADKIEDISVPDDPSWLTTVKFIFYIISIVAIIIYIVVVTLSGDLKDQFHLMGMNMSVAILCGSIAMIVTDLPSVRSDRHTCTAFGMLIHFFYSATGLWSLTLGHASFKAITAGVIGGRLKSYMFLSWGGALALSGLPFVDDWRELGTDPRCFIAWDDGVKMIFFFPQILFVGGGLFCAIVILCNLSAPALRKENLIEDYGSFCRGTAFLNIVIALTWTFGLLAYVRFDGMDTNFYPIFQVLNSLCGLLLLLFIGIGSNRFRMFLAGQAKKRRQMIKSSAFGLPDQAEDSSQQEAGPIPPTEEPLVPISKEGKKEKKKKGKKGKKK